MRKFRPLSAVETLPRRANAGRLGELRRLSSTPLLASLLCAALTLPVLARSPETWLDLHSTRRARKLLLSSHPKDPQLRFENLLLRERLERLQGNSQPGLLDQAERIAPPTRANRLRIQLRRYLLAMGQTEESRRLWQQLEAEWQKAPEPTVACEYYLTRSRHFRDEMDEHSEESSLAQARQCAKTEAERLRIGQAYFSFYLNKDAYEEAEQELLDFTQEAGPDGLREALRLQGRLAQRRGRSRLYCALTMNLADLERAAGEPEEELEALLALTGVPDAAGLREQRAWKLVRAMPADAEKLTKLIQLGRKRRGKPIWPEALSLWRRLPWKEQRKNFQFCIFHLRQDGLNESALELCQEALRREPDWPPALLLSGECLQAQGRLQEALVFYRQVLGLQSELSEQQVSQAASNLVSVVRAQKSSEDLLAICQDLLKRQPNVRSQAILLRQGLLGRGPTDSLTDQHFRRWCWERLALLVPRVRAEDQLDFTVALLSHPPASVQLAPVLERGLELSQELMLRWEKRENWLRYALVGISRAHILEKSSRPLEAVECLLSADQKLSRVPQNRGTLLLREQLMWTQGRAGQADASEATALRLLPDLTEPDRRFDVWLQLGILRAKNRPDSALLAYDEAVKVAPTRSDRLRASLFQASLLEELKRWPEVISLLVPLDFSGAEAWMRNVRNSCLSRAYHETGQEQLAEATLREAYQQASSLSWEERLNRRMDLVDFLRSKKRAEADRLVREGYQLELKKVSGSSRWKLLRVYVGMLLDEGKVGEALETLEEHQFPAESLGVLKERPELAEWTIAHAKAGMVPVEAGSFRETLTKIRGLRRDLDAHPLFQPDRLELVQRHLGPGQLLLAFCPAGSQMYILGVDSQRCYVYDFGLEGGWFQQQISQLTKSSEARQYVSSRLIAPIQSWIQNRDILLVPLADGWYVPWELLGTPALATTQPCTRVSSTDLLHLAAGDWRPFELADSLALGAPPEAGLEGARRELESMARLLPRCRLAIGNEARLEALHQPASLIHLASHSEIVARDPDASFLQLAQSKLTLREIYRMKMLPHSLVVLSSCSSARGQAHPEGEPLSLSQAFAAAGSQTQISTLWPVDDESTALFFEEFYSQLRTGTTPAKSLLAARRALAAKGLSAADWGAFVLQGCPD